MIGEALFTFHCSLFTKSLLLFLLAANNLFDVIQLVESLHWSEIINIETEYLITNLTENGVIQLEET
jgi:hypothetical protein